MLNFALRNSHFYIISIIRLNKNIFIYYKYIMVNYNCDKCNKNFEKKDSYIKHLNRKTPCVKITDKIELIKLELTENHIKETKKIEKKLRKEFNDKLEEQKLETKKIISQLFEQLAVEKEKNKVINNNVTINNTNNNNTNNIQQNNTIKLNPYRKEDLSHITDQEYNRLLSLGYGSVPSFVKKIHFNDEKPENHNILLSRADCNDIYVYNNENEWECKDKNIVIEQIISDKTNMLYNKRLDKDDIKSYKFDNYFASFENEDKKKMKDVTESVKRVCLTGKDKVMKTKKLVAKKKLEN
jgi:hypothetical protein